MEPPVARRRARRLLLTSVLLGVLAAVGLAGPASAHAALVSTDPPAQARLSAAPEQIALQFDDPVEATLGGIRLYDSDQHLLDVGPISHVDGDDRRLAAPIRSRLGDGLYVVTWRVTSDDGHPVAGAFTFTVGASSSADSSALASRLLTSERGDAQPGRLLAVARWFGYVGLALLIGGLAFLAMVWPNGATRHRVRVLLWIGVGLTLASAAVGFALQGPYATGRSLGAIADTTLWREVTETRFGHAMGLRLAAAAAAIVLVALVRYVREAWWQSIAASAAAVLSFSVAFAGHAGSGRWTLIGLLLGVVHVLAMMVWVGGLAYLGLVVLRPAPPTAARSVGAAVAADTGRPPEDGGGDVNDGDERAGAVRRFSTLAFTCVVVLVATGLVQGWRIVVRFSDLWSTSYGRLLLGKAILVGLVVVVASVARRTVRRHWPAAAQLRQLVLCELALAGVILAATAVLVGTAPAADLRAATSAQGASATLVQDGMLASVVLAPAHQGTGNALHVYVSTQGGSLDAVDAVTARLTLPSRELGPIPLALDGEGANHFSSYDVTLPYTGRWQLELLVQQSNRRTRFATTIVVT